MSDKNIYQFFENIVSLFSVKAIDLAIAIWLLPYLILKVGIVNYGLYAFALSMVLFFVNITNYGFDITAVRALAKDAKDTKKMNNLFNEVFSVKLYLTGFLLVLLLVLIFTVPIFSSYKLLFGFASFLIIGDLFSLRWFFLGVEKMKYIPAINLVATLIYVLLVVLFIKQPKDFTYIILVEAIGITIAGVISFTYILLEYKIKIQLLPFVKVQRYLYHNFSSFIILFVPSMLSNAAVFMVGLAGIPTNVSIIQLAVKFSNAFATINAVFSKVFYSMVNRKIQLMRKSLTFLLILGVLLSLTMFFSAEVFIRPWLNLKDPHVESQIIWVIKLLSITPLLMALISAYGINGLLVLGKDKLVGYIILISTVVGLLLGLLLVSKYTYIGGVVFLLTARGLYAVFSIFFFKNKIRVT